MPKLGTRKSNVDNDFIIILLAGTPLASKNKKDEGVILSFILSYSPFLSPFVLKS